MSGEVELAKVGMKFSFEEAKVVECLRLKSDSIVSRDEIAQAVWGALWIEKYSDWQIDRLIYLVRKKLNEKFRIVMVRNRGYSLMKANSKYQIAKREFGDDEITVPTDEYLSYMNNPENPRRVLKNLFEAVSNEKLDKCFKGCKSGLVVNSYSYDNVDAVSKWMKETGIKEFYFINSDSAGLKLHQNRIDELKIKNVFVNYDNIRRSKLGDGVFDIVINDFRLNFNLNHKQNIETLQNMYRLLRKGGLALISVVVDARYESKKYGIDQEKAPLNIYKPWMFSAGENLKRYCFPVPYYKKIFSDAGFKILSEFDLTDGKRWARTGFSRETGPAYRRFLLKK